MTEISKRRSKLREQEAYEHQHSATQSKIRSNTARYEMEQAELNERMMQEEEERMMMMMASGSGSGSGGGGGSPGMMYPAIPWDAPVPFVEDCGLSTLNWRVEEYKEETEVRENNNL